MKNDTTKLINMLFNGWASTIDTMKAGTLRNRHAGMLQECAAFDAFVWHKTRSMAARKAHKTMGRNARSPAKRAWVTRRLKQQLGLSK
jgi:3-hydroxy-3-methylglutaryl CoA synthase